MTEPRDITALLAAHREGEQGAFDEAVARVYQEMRRVARGQRRRSGPAATLNTTAIVHEAYLKLIGGEGAWHSRSHFLGVAAKAMRHVAVDYARARRRAKRGGDVVHVAVDDETPAQLRQAHDILAVHRELERLEAEEPTLVRVVECRYFAGMTETECATALDVSVSTVQRAWRTAKERLREALGSERR